MKGSGVCLIPNLGWLGSSSTLLYEGNIQPQSLMIMIMIKDKSVVAQCILGRCMKRSFR